MLLAAALAVPVLVLPADAHQETGADGEPGHAAHAPTVAAAVTPSEATPGQGLAVDWAVTAPRAGTYVAVLQLYDSAWQYLWQEVRGHQIFEAGESRAYSTPFLAPSEAGTYHLMVGVWSSDWQVRHVLKPVTSYAVEARPAGRANLLPPGSALPSDERAAARVSRHGVEHRQRNVLMNQTVPASVAIPGYVHRHGGTDDQARVLADRVSGNFTGTTDEILQWGAYKWGFDEDFVRALAVQESWWEQTAEGDWGATSHRCAAVGTLAPCPESYGILQVRPPYHPGTWPDAATSTAFNVDYALMFLRVAYEGYLTWLYDLGFDDYRAGDEWGAAGVWVSGRWYSDRANQYIREAQHWHRLRPWTQTWFQGNEWPPQGEEG